MSRLYRRPLAVLSIVVAAILGATVLATTAQAITASTTASAAPASLSGDSVAHHTAPKPTVVLVHGGWADSSGWNDEIAALHKQGYPVIAPANPLRGLSSDADYIRSVLQTIDGPIVLVGHSYGGAVISNAAVGVPNVKALVLHRGVRPGHGRVARPAGEHEPRHPHHTRRPHRASLPAARRRDRDRPLPEGQRVPDGVRRRPAEAPRPA